MKRLENEISSAWANVDLQRGNFEFNTFYGLQLAREFVLNFYFRKFMCTRCGRVKRIISTRVCYSKQRKCRRMFQIFRFVECHLIQFKSKNRSQFKTNISHQAKCCRVFLIWSWFEKCVTFFIPMVSLFTINNNKVEDYWRNFVVDSFKSDWRMINSWFSRKF